MGCGVGRLASSRSEKDETADWVGHPEVALRLPSSRLHFSPRQLTRLNRKFCALLDRTPGRGQESQAAYLSVIVERLVQRLVCNVGNFDRRFSSKFLINLEPLSDYNFEPKKNHTYKYLVRLDLVSSPAIYPDLFEAPVRVIDSSEDETLPQGYARVRVHGEFLEEWMGFIGPAGYLKRDKIQERFIELLARASAKPTQPIAPREVDESRLCGSPGKVVDPITLHHILQTSPSSRFYFGTAECNESRFPDPRDFRIAIVEGVPEIRLHVSFLSPTAQSITSDDVVEISIVLGIGVAGWPSASSFPFRYTLDHPDIILGYHSAQLGYYLVPKGPHSSLYCDDRSSAWEIRAYATEMFLQHHYSPTSVVFRIQKILIYLLEVLRARGVKSINRYIVKNLLLFELEEKWGMQQWAPKMTSRRVLSVFDRLLNHLRCQNVPSYFFPDKNLLLQEDGLEDDYVSDGDILETYLKLLHADGPNCDQEENYDCPPKDTMENVMLQKWEKVVDDLLPSKSHIADNPKTRVRYTRQQLEYIALFVLEVLKLKNVQKINGEFLVEEEKKTGEKVGEDSRNREDFIYLMQIMLEQAKQKLASSASSHWLTRRLGRSKMYKLNQILLRYDISTAMLLDDLRKNEEMNFRFRDDVDIVAEVIRCLYGAIDSDDRILGPIIRPYLDQLFRGSHENCWFLQEWKKKIQPSEVRAMEAFGHLALSGRIDPTDGITNAAGKGWTWAGTCLGIIRTIAGETSKQLLVGEKMNAEESNLRLIFTPEPEKTIRFRLTGVRTKERRSEGIEGEPTGVDSRYATIRSFQEVLNTAISSDSVVKPNRPMSSEGKLTKQKQPPHVLLRDGNPFTVASMEVRRQGNHRGLGSVVQALISLQKLTVLQEISQYLPEGERTRVLSDIKKLSKEIQRLTVENYRKNYLSSLGNVKSRFSFKVTSTESQLTSRNRIRPEKTKSKRTETREFYRTKNEFDVGENSKRKERPSWRTETENENGRQTLLDACRSLRRQQRTSAFGSGTFPKSERYKRGPESVINTPFYIKISKALGEVKTPEF